MRKIEIILCSLIAVVALSMTACVVGGVPKYAEYTVEHYLQNLANDEEGNKTYTLELSETQKCGVNDKTAANANEYVGYTAQTFSQVKIEEEGTVVKIYYDRNTYSFAIGEVGNGALVETSTENGDYIFGTEVTAEVTPADGYKFVCWQENSVCANPYTFELSANTTLTPVYEALTPKITIPNFSRQVYTYEDQVSQAYELRETMITGFTVEYKLPDEETWSQDVPTLCGTFDVKITRAEDDHFNAFSQVIGGGFVMRKASYDMSNLAWNYTEPLVYNGYTQTVKVTGINGSITVNYENNSKLEIGNYHATASFVFDTDHYNIPTVTGSSIDWSIVKKTVDIPSAGFKYYNSAVQVSDLKTNALYTVDVNDGGSEIGFYDVTLTLVSPEFSEWNNGSGEASVTVQFEIRRINPESVTIRITKSMDGGDAKGTLVEDNESALGYHINFSILDTSGATTLKEGYAFVGWYLSGVLLSSAESYDYSFSYSSLNINVVAEFRLLSQRKIDFKVYSNSIFATIYVNENAAVGTLPVAPNKTDNTFQGWFTGYSGTGTQLVETFVPTEDAVYYAYYTVNPVTYRVNVTNGTVNGNQYANVVSQTTVTLYCADANFSYWEYDHNIISYSKSYQIKIKHDSDFTAVLGAAVSELTPSVCIYDVSVRTPVDGSYGMDLTSLVALPEGYTFVEAGALTSYYMVGHETYDRTEANFVLGATKITTIKLDNVATSYDFSKGGYSSTYQICLRVYLIYKDAGGAQSVVYSPIMIFSAGE